MNAPPSAAIQLLRRSHTAVTDSLFVAKLRVLAAGLALAAASAAAVTYAPVPRLFVVALPVALGVAFLVFASTRLAAVLLGASIPEIQDVTGGHLGLHVAASDVVLVLVGVGLFVDAAVSHRRLGVVGALRPVRAVVVQYGWLIVVLLVLHFGAGTAVKSMQRLELFVLPLLAGAFFAMRREHMVALRAYVLAATLLAVVWPILNAHGLEGQFDKNTAGQLIACGILLLVGIRGLRRLLPCLPVLVVGLALTASRGSVLAVVVGVAVLSMIVGGRSRRTLVARTLLIVVTGVAVYQLLPGNVAARLTNFSSATTTSGGYNIQVRFEYATDAERIIAANPWTGIGVGNYLAGDATAGTQTTDPHDVVLLQAAEGGYLFAASFVLLIVGAALAMWRLRWVELAPAAAAVLLGTAAHGLVDVYWVRGLPVLGFLLVGMVCGLAATRRRELAT
jgi:hypothetical protein